jgi:[ribosomal protein S18]-alanine N-acetyltransferase
MSDELNIPQVIIDQMQKDDLPEVLAIERESFPTPWTAGMFAKELKSSHARCLCARLDSAGQSVVAAYIIFWLIVDEIHLHNLAVKKEYRRQGLALELMGIMKKIAGENEITAQTLEVRESNSEAIKLYRKCGFVVKGVRPLYYTDTHEDALIMWADVHPVRE